MAKANITAGKCRKSRNEEISVKTDYYLLLEQFIGQLQKEKIPPVEIISLLPEDVASQLTEVNTITNLFKFGSPLYDILDWRSLKFFVLVSNLFEDEKLNKGLRNYCAKLTSYNIKHGSQVIISDTGIVVPHLYRTP